jgi:hypothetical protein
MCSVVKGDSSLSQVRKAFMHRKWSRHKAFPLLSIAIIVAPIQWLARAIILIAEQKIRYLSVVSAFASFSLSCQAGIFHSLLSNCETMRPRLWHDRFARVDGHKMFHCPCFSQLYVWRPSSMARCNLELTVHPTTTCGL